MNMTIADEKLTSKRPPRGAIQTLLILGSVVSLPAFVGTCLIYLVSVPLYSMTSSETDQLNALESRGWTLQARFQRVFLRTIVIFAIGATILGLSPLVGVIPSLPAPLERLCYSQDTIVLELLRGPVCFYVRERSQLALTLVPLVAAVTVLSIRWAYQDAGLTALRQTVGRRALGRSARVAIVILNFFILAYIYRGLERVIALSGNLFDLPAGDIGFQTIVACLLTLCLYKSQKTFFELFAR